MHNTSSTTALHVVDSALSKCRRVADDVELPRGCKSSSDDSTDRSSTGSWFSTSTATVDLSFNRPEVILSSISPATASADVVNRPQSAIRDDSKRSASSPETRQIVVGESATAMLDNDGDSEGVDVSASSPRNGRRNKRKMTEPRRRATTDFSIRSICSSSNSDIDVDNVGSDEEIESKRSKRHNNETIVSPPIIVANIDYQREAVDAQSIERPKPFSFYPLNIPMVFSSAHGTDSHRVVGSLRSSDTVSSAPASVVPSSHAAPTADPGRRSLTTVNTGNASRRRSASEDHIIPSPPKKDRNVVDDVLQLSIDLRSRRNSRIPEVAAALVRRVPFVAATTRSASASSDACSDDSTPRFGTARPGVVDESQMTDVGRGGARVLSPLRKNYKNMTKQRRIEANARERTRVHTISAAFESLRRAVPSYSYNQRLSKLAILRIACSYILALARLADLDSGDESSTSSSPLGLGSMTFADCVDLCTQTIQTEGKAKRRH